MPTPDPLAAIEAATNTLQSHPEIRCGDVSTWAVLAAALPALRAALAERDALRAAKDGAYDERNRLVALLASVFPSVLARHPDEDTEWEDDWRWIVFIDLPTGQATWHIHDSQLDMFSHVRRAPNPGWDGHTTEEKYRRVARAALTQEITDAD